MSTIDTSFSTLGAGSSNRDRYSDMTSEDFSKIILTELSNQDPLAPNDTSALVQQIANIRSIQSDQDLTKSIGSLVSQNEFAAASGLIGRTISGISDEAGRVAGVVSSVVRTKEGPVLALANGHMVSFGQVDYVRAEALPQSEGGEE